MNCVVTVSRILTSALAVEIRTEDLSPHSKVVFAFDGHRDTPLQIAGQRCRHEAFLQAGIDQFSIAVDHGIGRPFPCLR